MKCDLLFLILLESVNIYFSGWDFFFILEMG